MEPEFVSAALSWGAVALVVAIAVRLGRCGRRARFLLAVTVAVAVALKGRPGKLVVRIGRFATLTYDAH